MRKIMIASLIAAGLGLVGASVGSAAPVNNTVLKQIANMNDSTVKVGHRPDRSHWRWGSRGGRRCHVRWNSSWHPC